MPNPTPTRVREGWRIRGMTLADRLAYHIEPEPMSGCWIWIGPRNSDGYGWLSITGHWRRAHRLVYEQFRGVIAAGLTVDHLCRLRACVNPDHLDLVPLKENILRGISFSAENARKTRCPGGHDYTDDNTRIIRDGKRAYRQCRTCDRERWARRPEATRNRAR